MEITIVDRLPNSPDVESGYTPPSNEDIESARTKFRYSAPAPILLPSEVSFRDRMSDVYNQNPFRACTANAFAANLEYLRVRAGLHRFMPSRMFLYWYPRLAVGLQHQDAGCSIISALQAAEAHGYCPETAFQYGQGYRMPPTAAADMEARHHRIGPYRAPNNLIDLKAAMASGFAVLIGFLYFNSFFEADNNGGRVPMPQPGPAVPHAALLVGYSDASQCVILRNSWGARYQDGKPCGDNGYYYLPYEYVNHPQLTKELWILSSVGDAP